MFPPTTKGGPKTALHHRPHDPDLTKEEIAPDLTPPGGTRPGPFTDWLRAQRHRSDPVGSLAIDMAGDGGWPETGTLQELQNYLDSFQAPYFVLEALDTAWHEWETGKPAVTVTARPFGDNALALKAAGWAPIPILGGGKGETPGKHFDGTGVTGHDGVDLEGERLQRWIKKYGNCVVATRGPIGDGFWTIGIDCDHYGDKRGGDTLARWQIEFGPLPATYVSTSRDDGISGIRWFKVPVGWRGQANHPGVELVQRWHRQGVMPPSLHETRKVPYRWVAQGDLVDNVNEVPLVADLPWLPDTYLEGLRDDRPVTHGRVDVDDEDVLRLLTAGEPCQAVAKALVKYRELTGEGRACHDSMCIVQFRLLRLGEQGHQGVGVAMETLYEQFHDDRGDVRDTATEFNDAQHTAAEKVLAHPTPEDRKGCCMRVPEVKDIGYWLGVHRGTTVDLAGWLGETTSTTTDLAGWLGTRS
jgi:hypothetical protein